jgi:hypothetical protein
MLSYPIYLSLSVHSFLFINEYSWYISKNKVTSSPLKKKKKTIKKNQGFFFNFFFEKNIKLIILNVFLMILIY